LVSRLLEKRGHTVEVAADGQSALQMLESASVNPFDLVLMNMRMPEVDGEECLERIRAKEQQGRARIPIIALTAHAMQGDRDRFMAKGADAYLSKPIRSQELLSAIDGLFRTSGQPAAGQPTGKTASSVFDGEQFLTRCDGNKAVVGKLISNF